MHAIIPYWGEQHSPLLSDPFVEVIGNFRFDTNSLNYLCRHTELIIYEILI